MNRVMLRLTGIITLGCIVVVLVACVIGPMLPPEDEIIFSANLNNRNFEIYRMILGRGLLAPVTHANGDNRQPTWSPDGQQIAYVNTFESHYRIYVTNELGNKAYRLTDSNTDEYAPAWSPDNQFVAYENLIYRFSSQVVMSSLKSGEITRLSTADSGSNSAAWSPDSQLVAFASDRSHSGNEDIYTVDVHNGAIRTLINSEAYEGNPQWSPDGRYLSYTGKSIEPRIYLWDKLQSKSILLYTPVKAVSLLSSTPKWSSDSRFLLFTMGNLDAGAVLQLDVASCLQTAPACSPKVLTPKWGRFVDADWRPHQP